MRITEIAGRAIGTALVAVVTFVFLLAEQYTKRIEFNEFAPFFPLAFFLQHYSGSLLYKVRRS